MNMKRIGVILFVLAVLGLAACGTIRYSQPHPDAKTFHPKRICVLPVDAGTYEESKAHVDQIVANTLTGEKWFDTVVGGKAMQTLLESDESFRKTVLDYTVKMKTVSFSDPDLSKKIGDMAKVDAIILVNVDYWFYTKDGDDKIAKVGFGVKLVEAATGKIMWKGAHHLDEKYSLFKPALSDVARKLLRQLLNEMPH